MRELFRGYKKISAEDFKILWEEATFIFDTNVLLNLYRYQSSTRDELLKLLQKLSKRVWIPYNTGLEFYRNRVNVIAEQNKKFSEISEVIVKTKSTLVGDLEKLQLKKRHSLINPDELISGFDEIKNKFEENLKKLHLQQLSVTGDDTILKQIEDLFTGKIGPRFQNQDEVNKIQNQAEYRFQNKIPPGYKDVDKTKDDFDKYYYDGLLYERKYSDFIIWSQILEYLKKNNIKSAILITDDTKSDWYWKIESEGLKTVGPRPELINEAMNEAKLESFYMYTTEGFITYAKKLFDTGISQNTIDEISEVSKALETHKDGLVRKINLRWHFFAVKRWFENSGMENVFADFQRKEISFIKDDIRYRVIVNSNLRFQEEITIISLVDYFNKITPLKFEKIVVVFTFNNSVKSSEFVELIMTNRIFALFPDIGIVAGSVSKEGENNPKLFVPSFSINYVID